MSTAPSLVEVSRANLIAHLERVTTLLKSEEHDSYEGSIHWEAQPDKDTFMVSGAYRINDFGGQGFVHVFMENEL